MSTTYCDGEYDFVPNSEIEVVGQVRVHKREPWHLLTGEVVSVSDGVIVLDVDGPLADLAQAEAAEEAPDDGPA